MASVLAVVAILTSGGGYWCPQSGHWRTGVATVLSQFGQTLVDVGAAPPARSRGSTVGFTASIGPCLATLPAKSSTRQFSLPGASRVPRPAICTYSPVDLVGRSMAIRSTAGALNPVVSTPIDASALTSPHLKAAMMRSRSTDGVSPKIVAQLTPRSRSAKPTWLACSTPEQNTSQERRPSP